MKKVENIVKMRHGREHKESSRRELVNMKKRDRRECEKEKWRIR